MRELASLLWGTLVLRPYVLAFLVVHAWSAGRALGTRRAIALTGIVWATAFVAEWTSTRVGFPFGFYTYTEGTRGQELYWFGVAAFSLIITFAIGEVALGLVGLAIAGALAALLSLSRGAARAVGWSPGRAARTWQRETFRP